MARFSLPSLPRLRTWLIPLLVLVSLGGLTWYLVGVAERNLIFQRLETQASYRPWLESCVQWIGMEPGKRGMWVGRVSREIRAIPDQPASSLLAVELQDLHRLSGSMKSPGRVLYVSLREALVPGDRVPLAGEEWCMVVEWREDRSVAFSLVPMP
jgi:hypothetical protein